MFSFVQIIFWCLYLPIDLSFKDDTPMSKFMSIIDTMSVVFFMLDVMLNFNVGFFIKGVLIMERQKIILNYLSTWFLCDFIASLPYEWIIRGIAHQEKAMVIIHSN